ncbi:MAG: response regulator transcription factor [Bacteroidota bacterium]
MKKMRCLIIEDESLARALLVNYVQQLPHLELVGEAKDPVEAMAILEQEQIDLLLLDIQMPQLTGIEFLNILTEPPLVIFTTAYANFALQGYELNVVDYLLKPFSFQRFVAAIEKARKLGLPSRFSENESDILLVKAEHRIHRLRLPEIRFIKGMREYVAFFVGEQKIMSLRSLKSLETQLPPDQFLRIHKSYIVGIRHVHTLENNHLLVGEERLPIGANYKAKVLQQVFS